MVLLNLKKDEAEWLLQILISEQANGHEIATRIINKF